MQIIPNVAEDDSNLKKIGVSYALLFKWIFLGIVTGIIVGLAGTLFCHMLSFATTYRQAHPIIILCLPLIGPVIVFMYHFFKDYNDTGTNLIIKAITNEEKIPLFKAPLIIISTFLTHLFGGSAGREGAALQFGGSLGYNIGEMFRLDTGDKKILTMSGMAAAFSALFGTPMAASVFAIELASVGSMHYAALVPCVTASIVSLKLSRYLGVEADAFKVKVIPELTPSLVVYSIILSILCAMVSILFCLSIKYGRSILDKFFKNAYLKAVAGGLIIVLLSLIFRSGYYNGAGMNVIEMAFEGTSPRLAFLIKLLFTAITLGAGYKGGEIVPTFFVGATFGCLFANITGFPIELAVAMSMTAVFCGVTNCPIASLLIAFEMFGFEGMIYYLITVSLGYAISGYYGLYGSQQIRYSKLYFR